MEAWLPLLIVGGIAVFVISAIVISYQMEKKRRERLIEIADSLKLQFFPGSGGWFASAGEDTPLQAQINSFQLFSQGRGRRMRNMIFGDAGGTELAIFDYQYTTGSGKHSKTWRQSVMYMQSNSLMLPQFIARPEHFFDKIGGMLGFKDINFDEHPEFSAAFALNGEDENAVRRLFTTELMDFFMQHREMTVEASGNQMVFYRPQRRVKPDQVRQFMQDGFEVFGKLQAANDG